MKESVGSATVAGMFWLIAQLQALGLSGDAMATQKNSQLYDGDALLY